MEIIFLFRRNDFLFGCIQGQQGVCELGDQRPPAPCLCLQDPLVEHLTSQSADVVRLLVNFMAPLELKLSQISWFSMRRSCFPRVALHPPPGFFGPATCLAHRSGSAQKTLSLARAALSVSLQQGRAAPRGKRLTLCQQLWFVPQPRPIIRPPVQYGTK